MEEIIMKKAKFFFKNMKKRGLRYAVATVFMFTFENSSIASLRRFSNKCYDYAYALDDTKSNQKWAEAEARESKAGREVTPCGCTIFNDCRECSSYPMCHA